jgi:hypothetical protein
MLCHLVLTVRDVDDRARESASVLRVGTSDLEALGVDTPG